MGTIYKNATVFSRQRLFQTDIAVDDRGRIVSAQDAPSNFDVVDLTDLFIFPGFADLHVHLREPGFSYKETIKTGTQAAAHGGYTVVCAMPNLNPPPDSAQHLKTQLDLIEADAVIDVLPYGCITVGQKGEKLCDFAAMEDDVCGFSDDGKGVQNEQMMLSAMKLAESLGMMIAAHCEDESELNGGYIHDGEYAKAHGHRGINSRSEWAQIERDIELVRQTGCSYHVCHVSTAQSIALIAAAKEEGLPVTCETAPHYLLLCDEDLVEDGRFKMNPPLRSRQDMEALRKAAQDGTLDCIATDHAPHSEQEKSLGLEKSAMGITGLECAFSALYTGLVKTEILSLEQLIMLLSAKPREILGMKPLTLFPGSFADFSVWDLKESYTLDKEFFISGGKTSPFEGKQLFGKNIMTIKEGKTVWKASQEN